MPDTAPEVSAIRWQPLIWGGAILAVVFYNGWSVCCGRCTLRDLTVIPWHGWLLIAVNLLALATLWRLRQHATRAQSPLRCRNCREQLQPNWPHCPYCGASAS